MTFYDLSDRGGSFVDHAEGNDWETIVCPKHEDHRRAGRRTTVLILEVLSSSVVDFSWTTLGDIVATEGALQVMKDAGLTGYKLEPVRVASWRRGIARKTLPNLWELIVSGSGGHAHPDSGIVPKRRCEACGHVRYSAFEHGIIVDESQWDGSDFFSVVEYPKHVLVTARAKQVLEKHGLTNMAFVESPELKWPAGVARP